MPESLRDEIDRLIASGDAHAARRALEKLWLESAGPATAGFVVTRFERLRGILPFTSCRVAIIRSFTLEPAITTLRALAFLGNIDLDVRLGDFNAYAQEILDQSSWLYTWKPDVVILAAQTRDLAPVLWEGFADLDHESVEAEVSRATATLINLIDKFRTASTAHLIIHSLQIPTMPARGLLDSRASSGQVDAIHKINDALHHAARSARNIYILDYNALIARFGETHWQDERKWLMARMPIAAQQLIHLAAEWMRFLHPITGRICKVLAVDLDNTLWGGVIGEDGIDGIRLDENYPGAAFRAVQRAMLDLYRRGILLAICSKNNPAEAMEVLEKHPGMLLKPEHFAAIRINWADKAENLRAIANELNVGIESIAFLDDNPVEREWVATQIPEIMVINLPADPMQFAMAIRQSPVFERLELTADDQARGQVYAEQRQRTELQQSAASLEDFYRSLQMRVRIEPVNVRTLARAAQLTQKTNQFNLTARRYSEEQLAQMLKLDATSLRPHTQAIPSQKASTPSPGTPGEGWGEGHLHGAVEDPHPSPLPEYRAREPEAFWRTLTLQVTDRFGDNGVVAVAILKFEGDACEIDTFLLSCRVIGRTIETAFLAAIARGAIATGAKRLTGWFLPTRKNAPAADYYQRHGFAPAQESNGAILWELDLAHHTLAVPPWITIEGMTK